MKLQALVVCALTALGCHGGSVVVSSSSVPHEDNFFATWEIQSSKLGPVSCEQAAAVRTNLDVVNTATGDRRIFTFACNVYQGTSAQVAAGTYDALMDLIDVDGNVLSQTEVGTKNVGASGTIDLGHHAFVVP